MQSQSSDIGELAAALVAAQGEFSAIPKDSENPFFKSKYADLATVVQTTSPVLAKHGLAVSQFISYGGERTSFDTELRPFDTLTTWLIHKSGQYINDTMRLKITKDDAQGQGSAITYARRYAYMGVLCLVADEDDDGNKASAPKAATPYRAAATKAPVQVAIPDEAEDNGDEVIAKLGSAVKLKGIVDRKVIINVLNNLAKDRYDTANFMKLTEDQAKELTTWILLPPQTMDKLLDYDKPF